MQADKLGMPVWLAYYYKDPHGPDFDGCTSIEEVQTKWEPVHGQPGGQAVRLAVRADRPRQQYGVGSANVDRDWIYFQPNEMEEKPMEWTKIEGKQLRCTSAQKPACGCLRHRP